MCGRYTISILLEEIEKYFGVEVPEIYQPRYNSAPSQFLPVITNKEPNIVQFFKWGLIPYWSKDPNIGHKMINARSETITEKPSFKNPFKTKRCLVIADSYYEWKNTEEGKIPYRIKLKDNNVFAFAGIWEIWNKEESIKSFSIITTKASDEISDLHERMPVILPYENYKAWLNNELKEDEALSIIKDCLKDKFEYYQVSKKVNSPTNDNKDLILKIA
ncbi:MAG: SOS response-associated peptidase [Candidatus Sericytochromatia bacterium]